MTDSATAYIVVDRAFNVVGSYTVRQQALEHAWPLGGTVLAAPLLVDYRTERRRKALCRNCAQPLELSDDIWWHPPVEQRAANCLGPDGRSLGTHGQPERPHDPEADGCTHSARGGQEHLSGAGTADYHCAVCGEAMPILRKPEACRLCLRRTGHVVPDPAHALSWHCVDCGSNWGWVMTC